MFSMADIQAHVGRLADEFDAARRRADKRRASEFVEPVEPGLGTVTVLRTGELKAVELHTFRLTRERGSALGRAVLEAIERAERRARADDTE